MRGAFLGLTLDHGKREMMRAVVESSGFAVRSVLGVMEEVGCRVADLRVTGGLARLPLWCQARADITGKKVLLPEQEESDLVGNACVGFYGLEEFDTPRGRGGEPRAVPEDLSPERRRQSRPTTSCSGSSPGPARSWGARSSALSKEAETDAPHAAAAG